MVLPPLLLVGHPQESAPKAAWRTWVCLSEERARLHGGRDPSDTT